VDGTSRQIKVLIVDDHAMVREGLRAMLNAEGVLVVGEASSGREGIEMTRQLSPDVVLMDVRMPEVSGLTALEIIKADVPQTTVLMVTTYENPEYLAKAVIGGAAGYLLKSTSRQDLLDAIRTVADGGSLINRELLQEVVRKLEQGRSLTGTADDEARARFEDLTEREIAVLRLVVEGLSNRDIADVLCISAGTVKTHVEHVIQKLQVSDRTQAAVWAVRHGLVH
jgi:DNA-binding NarL/FixJ family response regulator